MVSVGKTEVVIHGMLSAIPQAFAVLWIPVTRSEPDNHGHFYRDELGFLVIID